MDRRKDLLLLPYTYIPSSSTVGLQLHRQHYQRCEPMISKMWEKANLFWVNHIIITSLQNSRFWRRTVTVNLKKFSSNTIFRCYIFGIFYIVKFNYFNGRPNEVKKSFWNIFDGPLWTIKKFLHQCHPPYTRRVSSHRVLYL